MAKLLWSERARERARKRVPTERVRRDLPRRFAEFRPEPTRPPLPRKADASQQLRQLLVDQRAGKAIDEKRIKLLQGLLAEEHKAFLLRIKGGRVSEAHRRVKAITDLYAATSELVRRIGIPETPSMAEIARVEDPVNRTVMGAGLGILKALKAAEHVVKMPVTAALATPSLATMLVTSPKKVLKGLVPIPETRKALGHGWVATAEAAYHELPETAALAFITVGSVAKVGKVAGQLRRARLPQVKRLARAANVSPRQVAKMTPTDLNRALARLRKHTGRGAKLTAKQIGEGLEKRGFKLPPGEVSPTDLKAWERVQRLHKEGKVSAQELQRVREIIGKRATRPIGKGAAPPQRLRKVRRPPQPEVLPKAAPGKHNMTFKEFVDAGFAKRGNPRVKHRAAIQDAVSRGVDIPAKVLKEYPDIGRTVALRKLESLHKQAVRATKKGEAAGLSPEVLEAQWNKTLKPAIDQYNRWGAESKRQLAASTRAKRATTFGEAPAHARTARRAAELSESLGARPEAYVEPYGRPRAGRALTLQEFPRPGVQATGISEVVERPVPGLREPTLGKKIAKTIETRGVLKGEIGRLTRGAGLTDKGLRRVAEGLGIKSIKTAGESQLVKLRDILRSKGPSEVLGQFQSPTRYMEKLGLGKEVGKINQAQHAMAVEAHQIGSRFKKFFQDALKEAGDDLTLNKIMHAEVAPVGPATRRLFREWRILESQMSRRKGVPVSGRIGGKLRTPFEGAKREIRSAISRAKKNIADPKVTTTPADEALVARGERLTLGDVIMNRTKPLGPKTRAFHKEYYAKKRQLGTAPGEAPELLIGEYYPSLKAGERGLQTSMQRRGLVSPENRAPAAEAFEAYLNDAMRKIHMDRPIGDMGHALREMGYAGERAPFWRGRTARDILAATRGQLKKTPGHKAARIAAGAIHGGLLSAPASWLANLTQMMNTISDVGFVNTMKAVKDWTTAPQDFAVLEKAGLAKLIKPKGVGPTRVPTEAYLGPPTARMVRPTPTGSYIGPGRPSPLPPGAPGPRPSAAALRGPALARKYRMGLEPEHLIESLGARRGGGGVEEAVSKVTGKMTAGFSAAERLNKQTSFRLHYATAKRAGLSHRNAIQKALKGVAEEHFFYGPTGTPVVAQKHPLAAQYTSYPLLQTEWFAKALRERPEALARYGTQLYGLSKGMKALGVSPEAVSPTTLYPFERRPGGDVGVRLPPALQRGRELLEFGAAKLAGEPEEARRRGRRLVSGVARTLGRVPFGISRGAEELKGQVTSPTTGLPLYQERGVPRETRAKRAALYALGFTPEEHARQRHLKEAVGAFESESGLYKRRQTKSLVDAIEARDLQGALRIAEEAEGRGVTITGKNIDAEREARKTSALERELKTLSKEEARRLVAPPPR